MHYKTCGHADMNEQSYMHQAASVSVVIRQQKLSLLAGEVFWCSICAVYRDKIPSGSGLLINFTLG